MDEFSTPMVKQYLKIKEGYPDCLLFYRMGDFYELFFDDAITGSQILNITLTGKSNGKSGKIPMAGVPFHAVDTYLSKLVQAGFKVAVCEQVSLPNKYGLVDREVIRVVTPGTVMDEKALEKKVNNYIISICLNENICGFAVADLSTGYFETDQFDYSDLGQSLRDQLIRLSPSECILPLSLYNDPQLLKLLRSEKGLNISCFHEWEVATEDGEKVLKDHFGVVTLAGFAIEEKKVAIEASAALLTYLKNTQKSQVSHIRKITHFNNNENVELDRSTILNLELFSTIRERESRGSLLFILDQTITSMGGRLLKQWICKPLINKSEILKRYEVVNFYLKNSEERENLRELLKEVIDIERIVSRLSVGLGNARDLISLKNSLLVILEIKEKIRHLGEQSDTRIDFGLQSNSDFNHLLIQNNGSFIDKIDSELLQELCQKITDEIADVVGTVNRNILDEPNFSLREGNLIKSGVNEQLDNLKQKISGSKEWILNLEKQERDRTGINSLKVRFNKVFGYFLEVSKSNLSLVPENYIRKQTLVNGERFITNELKKHEEIILTAEEKIHELEYKLFLETLEKILTFTPVLQESADAIAILDCLLNFAFLAEKNSYTCANIIDSGEVHIVEGRHPVVEKVLDTQFVPNDLTIGGNTYSMMVITGPNMAGKSVYLRQIALISLMAQIGCFVPAKSAQISLVDRIFVRSGASDAITSGLSTFMVEMVETAHILHHATEKSLVIMDEIGRGTSTYDGISIAWAVAEFLVAQKKSPKTLFATHYHELQELESHFPEKIKNFHMSVANNNDQPIFLHTIAPGGASSSFGIAVAKMAGVPDEVVQIAEGKLQSLEMHSNNNVILESRATPELDRDNSRHFINKYQSSQNDDSKHGVSLTSDTIAERLVLKELENMDISQMTPLEALNKLAELKHKSKLFVIESKKYLEVD